VSQDVTIIIGTHRNFALLRNCLRTLYAYTLAGYELIIVDNATDIPSKKLIALYQRLLEKDLKVIINPDNNKGFAEWNNQAVNQANRKYVLFLNDDTVLVPEWLTSMLELTKVENWGAISKKLLDRNGKETWHKGKKSGEVDEAPATCLLVKREDAYFDEEFRGYYFEDLDLILRLKRRGLKIIAERTRPIYHIGAASTQKIDPVQFSKMVSRNQGLYELRRRE